MSFKENNFLKRCCRPDTLFIALALACCAYATYIALRYAGQAPLDFFAFRQTQTALTSFWLIRDGFQLAYETPVGGPPWSIPFEFPLYQYVVALVAQSTPLALNTAGRLVSFVFLLLCLVPARAIVRQLQLPSASFYIFAALLCSSPLYLYWSRTFMIETTAVFFAVAAIRYFIDILHNDRNRRATALFIVCMSVAILQKATTGLPVLATLGLVYFFTSLGALRRHAAGAGRGAFVLRRVALALLYVGVPLAVGVAWTTYTDQVKSLNPLGAHLTAAALGAWNWGTAAQRLSSTLFHEVLWQRMVLQNGGGLLGVACLLWLAVSGAPGRVKVVAGTALAMGIAPLFLFTNLHLIHIYYQTANVIFIIFALAVSIGAAIGASRRRHLMALGLTMLIAGSNYYWFEQVYRGVTGVVFTQENAREMAIGDLIRRSVPQDKHLVVFGDDWSSAMSYFSERKSFTVPGFMEQYAERSANPGNYIAPAQLGSVVLCGAAPHPSADALLAWAGQAHWKFGEVSGCLLALPAASLAAPDTAPPAVACDGSLDVVQLVTVPGRATLNVAGWNAVDAAHGNVAERVYVTLTPAQGKTVYVEALAVPRPDVKKAYGQPAMPDPGFSSVIGTSGLRGTYTVGVARSRAGHLEACPMNKSVTIAATNPV